VLALHDLEFHRKFTRYAGHFHGHGRPPGIESGLDAAELVEAAEQQSGADQQCDGERDLNPDEKHVHGAASRDLRAAGLNERRGGAQRGVEAADERGGDGAGERVEDDAPIECDLVDTRDARRVCAEGGGGCVGECESDGGAGDGEQQALGEELGDDRSARGAE
jgi:hypothetical protein